MTSPSFAEWLARCLRALTLRVVYFLPSVVVWASGWRLAIVAHPDRIGHLAGDIDNHLKELELEKLPTAKIALLANRRCVANERLLDYWATRIAVVRSPFWCPLLEPLYRFRYLRSKEDMSAYQVAIDATAQMPAIQRKWNNRPPLLEVFAEDRERSRQALEMLGVPEGVPFVCFHNREGGYSPGDEYLHSFRNSAIESYLPAMEALVRRGTWCIRMGDSSMSRMPPLTGAVDYAHSGLRDQRLDIALMATCRFFVGTTSGLFMVATAFGVPCCLTNVLPFSAAPGYGGPRDLGIPKLIWNEGTGRLMTFAEILGSAAANFRFAELYREHRLKPVENTAEEIRDLVLEMLDRLEGRAEDSPDDLLRQARFGRLMRPGHLVYGGASRVGRDFLRKYAYLLEQDSIRPLQ